MLVRTYRCSRSALVVVTGLLIAACLGGVGCKKDEPSSKPKKEIPVYTQKKVIDRVDWPASTSIDQTALAALLPEARAQVVLSGVPVLVPSDPKFLTTAVMIDPNEFGYDFGLRKPIDGIAYTLGASRVSIQSDAPTPVPTFKTGRPDTRVIVGNRKLEINRITGDGGDDEGPWLASWAEHGEVGYMITLVCSDSQDARCADNAYLRSIVTSLVYIGGSGK